LTQDEKPKGALLHILQRLENAGYKTTFNLYNTANFGVPQIRERLIFFASREGKSIPFMEPTHDEHGVNGLPRWRTFREALATITDREAKRHAEATVARSLEVSGQFFQQERQKLERWADDMVLAAEKDLADTKARIKAAQKILNDNATRSWLAQLAARTPPENNPDRTLLEKR
jgi:site-specific DNA-cytosine methylase